MQPWFTYALQALESCVRLAEALAGVIECGSEGVLDQVDGSAKIRSAVMGLDSSEFEGSMDLQLYGSQSCLTNLLDREGESLSRFSVRL